MAWTQTEPTLPNGSAWEQESNRKHHFGGSWGNVFTTQSVARLEKKQFAVRVKVEVQGGDSGFRPDYLGDRYLDCRINGVSQDLLNTGKFSGGTSYYYFVGEADAGAEIKTVVGMANSASSRLTTIFTAPAILGNLTYVRINGIWRQGQMKIKVGGVWQDVFAKIKTGGVWK